jgi:hypothetical protein
MNFKKWFLQEVSDMSDCIRGEWIYYPNGKLQNAIRSDINRGHEDLIKQFYIAKSKKPIIDFLKFLKNHISVDKQKLIKQSKLLANKFIYNINFPTWFPAIERTDITSKNFDLIFSAIIDLIKSDICVEGAESDINLTIQKFLEKSLGDLYNVLNAISHRSHEGFDLEYYAMKNEKIILVREGNKMIFDMCMFDRKALLNCIEAICAKNKLIKINNIELLNHLYNPTVMEKEIIIQTFPTELSTDSKTIKIRELLEGETPQTELEGGKGFLKVDPFSKAGTMLADFEKERWRQRTSESTNYKMFN